MGGLFGDRTASADRLNSAFESMSVNGPEGAGAIAARRAVRFAAVKRHTRG